MFLLVPAHPGSPGLLNGRVCVCVCVSNEYGVLVRLQGSAV